MPDEEPIDLEADDVASVAPAVPYNPLFAIRNDTGPFIKLGPIFACNKSRWMGQTLASPTAIYLLKNGKNAASYGGGIAGVMLASALQKDDQLATCTVADLPDPIRAEFDPKKKPKLATKPVVIIPQSTVSMITTKRMGGSIVITVGEDKFTVAFRPFRYSSTLKKLTGLGWSFNKELTPVDAPVHDARSEEERANPVQRPMWQRVLLTIGAILLVLLVIAIRVMAHLH